MLSVLDYLTSSVINNPGKKSNALNGSSATFFLFIYHARDFFLNKRMATCNLFDKYQNLKLISNS